MVLVSKHRTSVTLGFLAGIFLRNLGAFIRYFCVNAPIADINCLGIIFANCTHIFYTKGLFANYLCTVGTQILADPKPCFRELVSEKLLILLRDTPCLELIIMSSNFQGLLFLHDELLESA